ncbi:S41 family peptidase [Mucilaginibacter koreensis]
MKSICSAIAILLFSLHVSAQIDTVSNLSDQQKLYGLSKFWSEAAYNFAYFDHAKINWDSAYQAYIPRVLATKNTYDYYREIERFCALLKDGHTNVYKPNSLYKKTTYRTIDMMAVNHKFYVMDVPMEYKDAIPLGSELISVDGTDAVTYAKQNIFPYISYAAEHQLWNDAARNMFYGKDSSQVWHLVLRSPQGKLIQHNYQFRTTAVKWVRRSNAAPWKRFNYQKIDNVGYITINTFGDEKVIDDFKAILPDLYTCKGVIIDLRGNGGGSSSIGAEILKHFTTAKGMTGSAWKTRDHLASFKAWGIYALKDTMPYEKRSEWDKKTIDVARGTYWYNGGNSYYNNTDTARKIMVPLVILQGNNTASAAEDFLVILDGLKGRAVTMGQYSYGSTGQPMNFDLPGGGSARICTKRDTYPDGRDFVGTGIKPQVEINPTIKDIINNNDVVMKAAVKKINALAAN